MKNKKPQPIEKLFDTYENMYIWVKFKNGKVRYAYYDFAHNTILVWSFIFNKSEAINNFSHFLIADTPKF